MNQSPAHPGVSLSHEQARALIQKSLQALPDSFDQTALENHLTGCPSCAAYAAQMRMVDLRLSASLTERYPERRYSAGELDHRLEAMHTRLRRANLWHSARFFASLAGAAVILVALVLGLTQVANLAAPRPVTQVGGPAAATATIATVNIAKSTAESAAAPEPTVAVLSKVEKPTPAPLNSVVDASDLQPSGQLTQAGAEKLVRAWVFANNPTMNPEAQFPLEELFPMDVWARMQAQIFKVTGGVQQGETYLIRQAEVLHLGTAFGSSGMTLDDFAITDLDANNLPELLYTYPFGSGIAQTGLGIVHVDLQGHMWRHEYTNLDHAILRLEKFSDHLVHLSRQSADGSEWVRYGQVVLRNGEIVIQRDDADQVRYTSQRYGVSFNAPAGWSPRQTERTHESLGGQTGSFDLYSLGSGRSDEDLARACEQQANSHPDWNGAQPQIRMAQIDQQRSICLIISSQPVDKAQSALLFLAHNEQIAILQSDLIHMEAMGASLRFETPLPTPGAGSGAIDMTPQAPPVKLEETSQKLGELTLTEWQVVSASLDTPTHFEFNTRIPAKVLARIGGAANEGLERTNQQLAPFGYRLEGPTSAAFGSAYALYHGETLIKDNLLTFFAPSISDKDFALLAEEGHGKRWLVRKDAIEPWDEMLHRYIRPIFINGRLTTVEREGDGAQSDGLVVKQDGEVVFRYTLAPQPVKEAIKTLGEWNGQWVLEVNGTLIVDGKAYNPILPAEELFNWTQINGKPFFFFTRSDGKIGLWYNGQELPAEYDAVIHNMCCEPAAFNVINGPTGVWFYALKDGMWYFVELK